MKFFNFEKKENPVGQYIFVTNGTRIKTKGTREYIKEGYETNSVINRCIREIAGSCASCIIQVKKNGEYIENHPILSLLKRPNPMESGQQFMERIITDYLITGNIFITRYPDTGKPVELWALSPQHMAVISGDKGIPSRYEYDAGRGKRFFPVDQLTGRSQVFHFKSYNPENPLIGLSPLSAASLPGDILNEGFKWNHSLLANGARPSGILKFSGTPAQDAIQRLRDYFKSTLQGAANAGTIPMLTDGADWQAMDQSPKDMDYLNTIKEVTKHIASVLGVPLPLVDNDAASFNNMEQAKEKLWTDTVLPLINRFLDSFGDWAFSAYAEQGMELCVDMDKIPALEGLRAKHAQRLRDDVNAGILSRNEARLEKDYPELDGGNDIYISASMIPLSMAGQDQIVDDTTIIKAISRLGYSEEEVMQISGIITKNEAE